MNRPVEGRVTRRPAAVLLRASGLPALVVGGIAAACFAVSSLAAAASVGVGVALALVALSAGPALLVLLRSVSPPAAMLMALAVYATVVVGLAAVYLTLLGLPWLSGGAVAAGIGAATVAWLVGMIRAVPRLRILIFGSDERPVVRPSGPGQDHSPASPSGPPH